jgi:peptidoglycan/xylan/chitin deacetylase (PgdA/CDA1 family)
MPQTPNLKPVVPSYKAAGAKEIWLTFDDGPHPTHTKKVVATLAAHQITAVFLWSAAIAFFIHRR